MSILIMYVYFCIEYGLVVGVVNKWNRKCNFKFEIKIFIF